MTNNDAPDNGDFAAYLQGLAKANKSVAPSNPVIEDITDEERLRIQELTELPPISDDDLLSQALATVGDSNDYMLDENIEGNANNEGMEAASGSQDDPQNEETPLGFLGEHALELADQPAPEELSDMPPITDEELLQQALAHPNAEGDLS